MRKRLLLTIMCALGSHILLAQTVEESFRFSRTSSVGTARAAAMGGAMGALGGDVSTFESNPAGVGVFRKSELSITPSLNFNKSKTNINTNDTKFGFNDLGLVLVMDNGNSPWKTINFGFNYAKVNNFNQKFEINNYDSETSILDAYCESVVNYGYNDFNTGLAYDLGVIYVDSINNIHPILTDGERVNQSKIIKQEGSQAVYNLCIGANYMDKLYVGASVGIYSIKMKVYSTYSEIGELYNPDYEARQLDQFWVDEYLKITGVGTNIKVGVIYRPIPQIRLGAAIHTPNIYSMSYKNYIDMEAAFWNEPNNIIGNSPESRFNYTMTTPWRFILSAATVIGQKAIISADYEYVDYSYTEYGDDNDYYDTYDYRDVNNAIGDFFKGGHNFRIGAEYRFNSILSVRGGYNYQGSPYENKPYEVLNQMDGGGYQVKGVPTGYEVQTYSTGVGFNFGTFFCDAAYINSVAKGTCTFYDYYYDENSQVLGTRMKYKINNSQCRLTLGWRF